MRHAQASIAISATTHVFDGSETIESLSKEFEVKFKEKLTPEKIQEQMDRYQSIERIGLTRVTPLAIKQIVVKAFQKSENGCWKIGIVRF